MKPELSQVSSMFDVATAELYLTADAFLSSVLPKIRFRAFQTGHPDADVRAYSLRGAQCFRYLRWCGLGYDTVRRCVLVVTSTVLHLAT